MDLALFFVFVFLGTLIGGVFVLGYHLWRIDRGDHYAVVIMKENVWNKMSEINRKKRYGKTRLSNDTRSNRIH